MSQKKKEDSPVDESSVGQGSPVLYFKYRRQKYNCLIIAH